MKVYPVILSGGAGSRLWPLSRELYPKQLIPLLHDTTLLQDTALRASQVAGAEAPIIVCNNEHRFMVAEQLQQIGLPAASILLEPVGRNTAPAVAVAALEAQRLAAAAGDSEDPVILVLPADHAIPDQAAFSAAAVAAVQTASAGKLVTFGVVPMRAETGYGYVQAGADLGDVPGQAVLKFVEKPDADTAARYVADGSYYWNSGMFVFRAGRYMEELDRLQPAMAKAARAAVAEGVTDLDFMRLDEAAFAASPADSIDYAVMEQSADVAVIPLDAGWSDVGSWTAVAEQGNADADGNVTSGDVLLEGCRDTFVHAESRRLVAAVGLEGMVVVDTQNAVLVAPKGRAQDVKKIVQTLKASGRDEATVHARVYRPWGDYETIDFSDRFQVKRITVKPGAQLSLQMHHHRAEHWIVVKGTAKVTRDDETWLVSENESAYIPLGAKHRLENPGKFPLEMIEVQSGTYLGEDDIVRFDDNYGRVK